MELTFVEEEIPKITRAGGSGREPEQWENHLAPLKESPGKSFRVWTYENGKRSSAVSRMSAVRERLTKMVPEENWQLAVRPLPDAEGQFGVYVSYQGTYTPAEQVENAQKRQERSNRVRSARASAQTNGEADSAPTAKTDVAPSDKGTAKERVAAARANAK